MIRLLVTAPASGQGKTVVTCALLTALKQRGWNPCAFKCGPDYLDPMFHRAVSGVESHNLDLFLMSGEQARDLFEHACQGHGAAVCEGAMGFYDGLGAVTDRASAWHVADTLDLPVLLVLSAQGLALTLAAQIQGLLAFRPESHLVGVILNGCTPALCQTLTPALERETGLPVLGCMPRMPEAEIPQRHLGLYTAAEVRDLQTRLRRLAEMLEAHVDMERLIRLCEREVVFPPPVLPRTPPRAARIAVARDEAFCFLYAETLETLRRYGAEIIFFSPLRERAPPKCATGLYLPGGYPELYARTLSENRSMRAAIAAAVQNGLPTVAECGGFLYLGRFLQDTTGEIRPMAGVLPGTGFPAGKLMRFGYAYAYAQTDSLLFRAGERIPIHEFHHWESTRTGDGLLVKKPLSDKQWRCGFLTDTLYAGFPHLYFAGNPSAAARFVEAANRYGEQRN